MKLPALPETYAVLQDMGAVGSPHVMFAADIFPGTEFWDVVSQLISGAYLGEPLAVYRIKQGDVTADVSSLVAGEIMRAHRRGHWISNQARDFAEAHGYQITEAAE